MHLYSNILIYLSGHQLVTHRMTFLSVIWMVTVNMKSFCIRPAGALIRPPPEFQVSLFFRRISLTENFYGRSALAGISGKVPIIPSLWSMILTETEALNLPAKQLTERLTGKVW